MVLKHFHSFTNICTLYRHLFLYRDLSEFFGNLYIPLLDVLNITPLEYSILRNSNKTAKGVTFLRTMVT